MKLSQAAPAFRPVTLVLETQDDWDKFIAIVGNVAQNQINHPQQIIRAAVDLLNQLHTLEN